MVPLKFLKITPKRLLLCGWNLVTFCLLTYRLIYSPLKSRSVDCNFILNVALLICRDGMVCWPSYHSFLFSSFSENFSIWIMFEGDRGDSGLKRFFFQLSYLVELFCSFIVGPFFFQLTTVFLFKTW